MAVWGRLQAFLTGAAISRASSDAVGPIMEPVRQRSNQRNAVRVLDANTLAELLARLIVDGDEGQAEAKRSGVNANRLQALTLLAQTWPGLSELDRLSNRDLIGMGDVITALQRHGFPKDLVGTVQKPGPLVKLFQDILTPGELAAAIHRGLVPDPGLLKGEQPRPPFKVEAYPVYDIDALKEAQGSGYDHDRLGVLVGLQGLPMGTHEAAQALFRGIITHGDYIRAFNESNSRNEWAQAVLDQSRQIPTARDFLENALRGYRNLAEALEGAKRHGMSEADATMIYQNQGRPMVVRQITQALARGGKFKPEPGEIRDPYDAAIVEGNLKPAYYDLAKALRYTLPSPFVMRQLAGSGVWSEAKTAERLKWAGWFPQDADEAAAAWAAPSGGATADPHIAKAQTQLWNTTHSSYINRESSATVARNKLQQAGVKSSAVNTIIGIWDAERDLIRKGLSPANIKKAYNKRSRNALTGQPWTRDEALAALISLGWNVTEANDYLDIP